MHVCMFEALKRVCMFEALKRVCMSQAYMHKRVWMSVYLLPKSQGSKTRWKMLSWSIPVRVFGLV